MGSSRQEYWSGCHFLLQGIFLTQRSNTGLLHCRQIPYPCIPGMQEMTAVFLYFLYKEDKLGLIKKLLSHLLLAFLIRKRFQKLFDSTERKEQMKNLWYFPEHQNFLPQIQPQLHNEGATQPSGTSYC